MLFCFLWKIKNSFHRVVSININDLPQAQHKIFEKSKVKERVNTKGQFSHASFVKNPRFQIQLDKRPLSPGTSREASGVPGETGHLSSGIWNLGVFSRRCTGESLPLRVDFIHGVEFEEVPPPSQLPVSPLPVTRNPAWTLDAGVRWQLGGAVLFLQGTVMTLRFFRMCLTFCLFSECTRLTFTLLPEPRHCKIATVWFWMNMGLLASAWASEKRKAREENEASS